MSKEIPFLQLITDVCRSLFCCVRMSGAWMVNQSRSFLETVIGIGSGFRQLVELEA